MYQFFDIIAHVHDRGAGAAERAPEIVEFSEQVFQLSAGQVNAHGYDGQTHDTVNDDEHSVRYTVDGDVPQTDSGNLRGQAVVSWSTDARKIRTCFKPQLNNWIIVKSLKNLL